MKQRDKSAVKAILVVLAVLLAMIVLEAKGRLHIKRYRNRRFLVTCGNGAVQTNLNEQCDDGNEVNSDGCSSTCQIETGYTCSGDPSVCQKCGNSKKEGTEGCDDGNFITGDGCSSSCTVEGGWTCNGAVLSICQYCGNGIKEGTEACDDGNTDLIYYLICINSNKL